MKIPKLPFHNVIADLLYTIFFQGECIGTMSIYVSDWPMPMFYPAEARYAIIVAEADPAQTDKNVIVRFREDGYDPNPSGGMPLGHMGVYEVRGKENMERIRFVGTEPGRNTLLQVQFYN